jgi:cell pole-organizing protein PopZ
MTSSVDQKDDSLEELMASIRQLVYPSGDSLNGTHQGTTHSESYLPEISSFLNAIRDSHSCETSSPQNIHSAPVTAKDKTIEEFLKETMIHPLKDLIAGQENTLRTLMLDYVKANLDGLLKQWMDQNLSTLATQCIRQHLQDLQHKAALSQNS